MHPQMVFFQLVPSNYFGGRVLIPDHNTYQSDSDTDDSSFKPKKLIHGSHSPKDPKTSLLSIISDSSEVEVILIERSHLTFFPDYVQKDIYRLLETAFEADRPYLIKDVEKIKSKFR